MALPSSTGTLDLNYVGRISMLKEIAGIDVLAICQPHKTDPIAQRLTGLTTAS